MSGAVKGVLIGIAVGAVVAVGWYLWRKRQGTAGVSVYLPPAIQPRELPAAPPAPPPPTLAKPKDDLVKGIFDFLGANAGNIAKGAGDLVNQFTAGTGAA